MLHHFIPEQRKKRMKKLILSASLIATFMLYVVYGREGSQAGYATPSSGDLSPSGTTVPTVLTGMEMHGMVSSMPMHPGHIGIYRDGEYTGKVVDVYYGNVEVRAFIQNSELADVQFLQYPNDRQTSLYISSLAIPALREEAIQAQSANVDTISGATATSEGFVSSLEDALLRAKA